VASIENTILHAIYAGDGGSKLYWSFCQAPAAPNDWDGNIQILSEPGILETSNGRPAVAAIANGLMTLLAPQGFDGPVTENSQVARSTVPPSATVYQQNSQNEFLIVCHKGLTSGNLWIDVGVAI
jgi:hypothetical protein